MVEVKLGLRAVQHLRSALMQLAFALVEYPADSGYLVLVDPEITDERLRAEWLASKQALRPQVLDRLSLIVVRGGQYRGIPEDPAPVLQHWLERAVRQENKLAGAPLGRADSYYMVLKLLVHEWLANHGPRTTDWLMKTAGCSYPTVAGALKRLRGSIVRHSDRRVELRCFPRDEWGKLLAVADRVRSVIRFTDASGKPRTPDALLRRLQKLDRTDIAVGGVLGTRHHHPELDLVGNPRLDLSVHCPGKSVNLDFVERLDPALHKTEDPQEPAHLVLHFVRHREPLFEVGKDTLRWADPVECLLDLHEARLEPQALEFLNACLARREKAR